MPELPDIVTYVAALRRFCAGRAPAAVEIRGLALLRTVDPPPAALVGRRVVDVRRIGKRIVLGFEGDLYFVLHLMIAGRLKWRPPGAPLRAKLDLAALRFEHGALAITEAGSKKRANLHIVRGRDALAAFDRGGLDVLLANAAEFSAALARENHTVKRALTDPRLFDGIGNAYSDEILHCARLSPFKLTRALTDDEAARLYDAARGVLTEWIDRLAQQTGDGFPEKVTAFREEMAVHGKYRKPCPVCGGPVQRIVYAANEANYCPNCQSGGRLLADRALSQLLRSDWPKTLEELEERRRRDSCPVKD